MTTPTTGPAVLHLRKGVYVADDAELRDGLVTYHGKLRVRDLTGTRFYQPHTRTVKLAPGEWIEWIERDLAVAA